MADVKKVIDSILSGSKFNNSSFFANHVFTDEPILRTASQLSGYLPEKCRAMRELARSPEVYRHSEAWLFREQALFMADYTDDFIFNGTFVRYFPTYQSMSDNQLRGYFSWRTQVRAGNIQRTSLSFAFVYIYELLVGIGSETPPQGLEMLYNFWKKYSSFDPVINLYMPRWLSDYCAYYNLPAFSGSEVNEHFAYEEAVSVLLYGDNRTEEERFAALEALSSYSLSKSPFFKKNAEDMKTLALRVWDAWASHYEKHNKITLCEALFGKKYDMSYEMFASAVFYDNRRYTDYTYEVNKIRVYHCRNGIWTRSRLSGSYKKNTALGAMLHTLDRLTREYTDYPGKLMPRTEPKFLVAITEKEIELYYREKKEREKPVIEIDLSQLDAIRQAAEQTKNKLIIEESSDFSPEPTPEKLNSSVPKPMPGTDDGKTAKNMTPTVDNISDSGEALPLTETERFFLSLLLKKAPYRDALRERHLMPALLADSINDKLMDIYGDTVLICEDDTVVPLEDYADDLRERLGL